MSGQQVSPAMLKTRMQTEARDSSSFVHTDPAIVVAQWRTNMLRTIW